MGMRRRSRRRGLIAGAAIGHHMATKNAEAQQAPAEAASGRAGAVRAASGGPG